MHQKKQERGEYTNIRRDAFLDQEEGGLEYKWRSYYSHAAPVVQKRCNIVKKIASTRDEVTKNEYEGRTVAG